MAATRAPGVADPRRSWAPPVVLAQASGALLGSALVLASLLPAVVPAAAVDAERNIAVLRDQRHGPPRPGRGGEREAGDKRAGADAEVKFSFRCPSRRTGAVIPPDGDPTADPARTTG